MATSRLSGVRLSKKDEQALTRIWTALRDSGASDIDIDNATPGLVKAFFANSRIYLIREFLLIIFSGITMTILLGPWILASNKFISEKLPPNIVSDDVMFHIVGFWFLLTALFAAWRRVLLPLLDIQKRPLTGRARVDLIFYISMAVGVLYLGFSIWRERFSDIEKTSIWSIVIVVLSALWVLSFINVTVKWFLAAQRRILAFLYPDSALVISLCNAFLAIRNETSWHDQNHRNRIARHLAVAADALEKFMPRGVAAEAGLSSLAAVRQRFKETAIPLRQQIVWLATPGPLTRADLEAEFRKALVAASRGELARLEEFPDRTQPIQVERRPWWVVMTDLGRGIAWALIPLALVQLGSALQLPLLSEPDQQAAAQKAAYIWLALAILRALSPGNFKETIEAAGTLLGRTKSKGAE